MLIFYRIMLLGVLLVCMSILSGCSRDPLVEDFLNKALAAPCVEEKATISQIVGRKERVLKLDKKCIENHQTIMMRAAKAVGDNPASGSLEVDQKLQDLTKVSLTQFRANLASATGHSLPMQIPSLAWCDADKVYLVYPSLSWSLENENYLFFVTINREAVNEAKYRAIVLPPRWIFTGEVTRFEKELRCMIYSSDHKEKEVVVAIP